MLILETIQIAGLVATSVGLGKTVISKKDPSVKTKVKITKPKESAESIGKGVKNLEVNWKRLIGGTLGSTISVATTVSVAASSPDVDSSAYVDNVAYYSSENEIESALTTLDAKLAQFELNTMTNESNNTKAEKTVTYHL